MPKPIPTHVGPLPEKPGDGFSLIELLIVVAIILIITAIAVPNFIRAKVAANQSAAIENCRTITTTEILYYTSDNFAYAAFAQRARRPGHRPAQRRHCQRSRDSINKSDLRV